MNNEFQIIKMLFLTLTRRVEYLGRDVRVY